MLPALLIYITTGKKSSEKLSNAIKSGIVNYMKKQVMQSKSNRNFCVSKIENGKYVMSVLEIIVWISIALLPVAGVIDYFRGVI